MKVTFLCVLLCCSIALSAQTPDSLNKTIPATKDNANYQLPDSIVVNNSYYDSLRRAQSISVNMDGIIRLQEENRSRQKKAAMIRIAVGIGFLVILVVGLMRRRKKPAVDGK